MSRFNPLRVGAPTETPSKMMVQVTKKCFNPLRVGAPTETSHDATEEEIVMSFQSPPCRGTY